jgi:uncharacterized protein
MGIAKQLHQLQETDLEIESSERALARITAQLADDKALRNTHEKLELEQKRLGELRKKQHSAEGDIEDISAKLAAGNESLFSGRIRNPKELSSLQQEVEAFKVRRSQLEEKALAIIDEVEQAEASVTRLTGELAALRTEWQQRHQELSAEMDNVKSALADLKSQREMVVTGIPPQAINLYQELRKGKVTAVVRVEQGICRGCRISLPVTELQRVKSGDLVRCGSCGRILFLA